MKLSFKFRFYCFVRRLINAYNNSSVATQDGYEHITSLDKNY